MSFTVFYHRKCAFKEPYIKWKLNSLRNIRLLVGDCTVLCYPRLSNVCGVMIAWYNGTTVEPSKIWNGG
jgi:hypothetical protein